MKEAIIYIVWSGSNDGLLTDKTIYWHLDDAVEAYKKGLTYANDKDAAQNFIDCTHWERIKADADHVREFDAQSLLTFYGKFIDGCDFMYLEAMPLKGLGVVSEE